MKIIGFVEGAHICRGGMGITGVPTILRSVAVLGHTVALVIGGGINPGREEFLAPSISDAFKRKEGRGTFGIVPFRALAIWSFSPAILVHARRHVREADFVTLHSLYSFPVFAGYLMARIYRKPYAIWPHGALAPFQRGVSKRKKWLYHFLVVRRIMDNAAVVLYSAPGEREEIQDYGQHSPSVVIPDCMNPEDYSSLPARGKFRTKFLGGHEGELVVFLARVNIKKGLDLLIKSMALVLANRPQARLAIVGAPSPLTFGNTVEEWVQQSGIQAQTVMTGLVSEKEKLELLADADLFVLPSETENFGHSIFEAMASGVPVIVSDTLHYANQITEAGAGLGLKRDADTFASGIVRLLADPTLRHEMGTNGKRFAGGYSWEKTGVQLESTLESVLDSRPLPPNLSPKTRPGGRSSVTG